MVSRNFWEKKSKCSSFWQQVGARCRYAESWWGTVALLVLKHAARAAGKASWQGTSAFLCKIPTSPDLAMSRNKVSSISCKYSPALTLKKQDDMFALTRTYVIRMHSMARVNLNKVEKFMNTSESDYLYLRAGVSGEISKCLILSAEFWIIFL